MSEIGHCPPRVAKVSRWMANLCVLILIAGPLLHAVIIFGYPEKVVLRNGLPLYGISTLDGRGQSILFAISILFSLPWYWGIFQLRRLFICYAKGEIFSRAAARHLSLFALAWVLSAFATSLGQFAREVVLSLLTGTQHFALMIGSPQLSAAFYGLIFMVIAWVLNEAAIVAEEHRGFV